MLRTRHLRTKIMITLGSAALLYLTVVWIIQQCVLMPSFAALEHDQAVADLDRATAAVRAQITHVDDFVGDWAGWDDTLKFVQDGNAEFIASNLESNVFRVDSFDFLCLVRPDGTEAWRGGMAPDKSATLVGELPASPWPLTHPLLSPKAIDVSKTGIVATSHGPLLLVSRPITDSARKHPPVGWIVMGRFLNEQRIAGLATQTRLALQVQMTGAELDGMAVNAMTALHGGASQVFVPVDEDRLVGFAHLPALVGDQGLLLRVAMPRTVLARGRSAIDFSTLTTVAAVGVLFVVLLYLLQRIVVDPITKLTAHAVAIRKSDDLDSRLDLRRNDEIGVLATEFDTMVDRLAVSHRKLMHAAHEGGMSEVATAVLHDVGNALQRVSTSTGLLEKFLAGRHVQDLKKVTDLCAPHASNLEQWLTLDPRGRKVPSFLVLLAKSLSAEHVAMRGEVEVLSQGLQHVQTLVMAQQVNAGKDGAVARLDLQALFAEAEQLAIPAEPGAKLVIARHFASLPPLHLDKHRLLAVLINLLRNAHQSIVASGHEVGHITITAALGQGRTVVIGIADDGQGIAASHLQQIFQGGFTTKSDGHGVGLHTSANTIREMGGNIRSESAGEGRGAKFVIELPLVAEVLEDAIS